LEELKSNSITLTKLNEGNLELLRNWRNTPEISSNMEYRGHITSEDQHLWFSNLCTKTNYYFIINYQNRKIGLIHLNKFDHDKSSAHAGLFIAENEFTGTGISLGASLLLLTYAFDELNLDIVYAKIKRDNLSALKYNSGLGFVFEKNLNESFSLYSITKSDYIEKKSLLIKLSQVI
jgi:UDP-4-amino-4,6-dideoxy-N-acetyl-beta-L-altrosamine N-acetyltransferase